MDSEEDPAADFRVFLAKWLETSGWSQYQLGTSADIGQSIISRWLNPDPDRRTRPTDATLRKLAPIVGRSYDDLMRMSGYREAEVKGSASPDDPPELAALVADIRAGWHAADSTVRRIGEQVTRAAFHIPRTRRSRNVLTDNSGSDARVDKDNGYSRTHTVHASLAMVRSII